MTGTPSTPFGSLPPKPTSSLSSAQPSTSSSGRGLFGGLTPTSTTPSSGLFGAASATTSSTSSFNLFGGSSPSASTNSPDPFNSRSTSSVSSTSKSNVFGGSPAQTTSAPSSNILGRVSTSGQSSSTAPFPFGTPSTPAAPSPAVTATSTTPTTFSLKSPPTPVFSFGDTSSSKSDSPASATTNPFIFATGSVKLLVTYKSKPIVGSVSADALVLACPVWKNFLFPPWADSNTPEKKDTEKQVDCSEDDGEALLILMNIAHLNFDVVPAILEYAVLLQVAILVDKYDCIKLVRPWLESWMKNERIDSLKNSQEGWLFIAWVFGREQTFETLSRHLVLASTAPFLITSTTQRKLLTSIGKPSPLPMPPGIVESIRSCRTAILDSLLDIPNNRLCNLENAMRNGRPLCHLGFPTDNRVCDAAVYGSLMFGLASNGLYPQKTAAQVIHSVNHISRVLNSIQLYHMKSQPTNLGSFGQQNSSGHATCAMNLTGPVANALITVKNPVLDCHRVHMQIQRGERAKISKLNTTLFGGSGAGAPPK